MWRDGGCGCGKRFECFVGDVRPEVGVFETDLGNGFVRAFFRAGEGIAEGGDAQDAAAVRHDSAVIDLGPGVEDFDVRHFGHFVEAADGFADLELAGVTAARHDDTDSRPRIPFDLAVFEVAEFLVHHSFEQIE